MAPLRKDTQLNSDSKVKTQILNEQFQSVFTKEDDSHPQLEDACYPPIPTLEISVEGVRKLLGEFRVNKASWADNIPNHVLRELADELVPAPCIYTVAVKQPVTFRLAEHQYYANLQEG